MYGIDPSLLWAVPTFEAVLPQQSEMLELPTATDSLSEVIRKCYAMVDIIYSGQSLAQMAGLVGSTRNCSEYELDRAEFQCFEKLLDVLSPKLKEASKDLKKACKALSTQEQVLLARIYRFEREMVEIMSVYYERRLQLIRDPVVHNSHATIVGASSTAAFQQQEQTEAVSALSNDPTETSQHEGDSGQSSKRIRLSRPKK